MQAATGPRDDLIAKEHTWLGDSIDLYEFHCGTARKSFHVKGKQILFDFQRFGGCLQPENRESLNPSAR